MRLALPLDYPSPYVTTDQAPAPQVRLELSLSSVYLLLSMLIRTLSIAGAKIVGSPGFGVYLGPLFGFSDSQEYQSACT